jgi:hypothetical protein
MAALKNGKIVNGWCFRRHKRDNLPERYFMCHSTGQPWKRKTDAIKNANRLKKMGYAVTVMRVNYFYEPDPE